MCFRTPSASEIETRPPGSVPQHVANICHRSTVGAWLSSYSDRIGRSPFETLDLTSVSSLSSHRNFPRNIYADLLRYRVTVVGRTYLSGNKPVREYVRLFGEFTLLENLRCHPSATASVRRPQIEAGLTSGHERNKPDVAEARIAFRVEEDVFLIFFVSPVRENVHSGGRLTCFRFP